jgi:hypothetical protein
MKLSWICCKLINIIIHWPPFLKTSKGIFWATIPNYHKFTMCWRLFMCSNIVKVSKHDGVRLSKAEAMHPSTCPMNFECNK